MSMYVEGARVYFNRPKRPWPLEELLGDIRGASSRVAIASAWFTDESVLHAFIESPARRKIAVCNAADLQRPGSGAIWERLTQYAEANPWWLSAEEREEPTPGIRVHVMAASIGSGDWHEGVMHHKFAVIDFESVWMGSYNFTYQARSNYETIVWISSPYMNQEFWDEADFLAGREINLWTGSAQFALSDSAFRCGTCERLFGKDDLGNDFGSWWECRRCASRRSPAA